MYNKVLSFLFFASTSICMGLLLAVDASAMTYSYTGNNFTEIEGDKDIFTTSDRVTASFVIDCALAHPAGDCRNLPYANYYESGAVEQTSLSFSAGPARLPTTSGDANITRFSFSTDTMGRMLEWDLDLVWIDFSGVINVDTDGGLDSAAALGGGAVVRGRPGRWTIDDSVPDITGTWKTTKYWRTMCRWDGKLDFSQTGNPGALTGSGTVTIAPGDVCKDLTGSIDGAINGSGVRFVFPTENGLILFTGIVSGDSMSGIWTTDPSPGFSGTWSATRVSARGTAIPTLPAIALILLGLIIAMLACRYMRLHSG